MNIGKSIGEFIGLFVAMISLAAGSVAFIRIAPSNPVRNFDAAFTVVVAVGLIVLTIIATVLLIMNTHETYSDILNHRRHRRDEQSIRYVVPKDSHLVVTSIMCWEYLREHENRDLARQIEYDVEAATGMDFHDARAYLAQHGCLKK